MDQEVTAVEIEKMARALFDAAESRAVADAIADGNEDPGTEPGTWDGDVDQEDQAEMLTWVRELVESGAILPGHAVRETPTTARAVVVDPIGDATARSLLRASRFKCEEMRTALISAVVVIGYVPGADARVPECVPTYEGLVNAASRWMTRFKHLADPPMEIEVEDDDDPDGTPVEGELWVKEGGP